MVSKKENVTRVNPCLAGGWKKWLLFLFCECSSRWKTFYIFFYFFFVFVSYLSYLHRDPFVIINYFEFKTRISLHIILFYFILFLPSYFFNIIIIVTSVQFCWQNKNCDSFFQTRRWNSQVVFGVNVSIIWCFSHRLISWFDTFIKAAVNRYGCF